MKPLLVSSFALVLGAFVAAARIEVRAAGLIAATLAIGLASAATVGAARTDGPAKRWVLAALVLSALLVGLASGPPPVDETPPAGLARLDLEIERTTHARGADPSATAIVIAGERVSDRRRVRAGARLSLPRTTLREGTRAEVLAELSPLPRFRNPTPHPPWPIAEPVMARARLASVPPRIISESTARSAIASWRAAIRSALERTLRPDAAGLARALLLGELAPVADADLATVRGAGLAHVLAVSGLHVAILAGLVVAGISWGARRVRWIAERIDARRVGWALGAPLALLYAEVAGAAPSARRAAFTAAIAWLLLAARRRPDAGSVAALAVITLAVIDPSQMARPSFLLSIGATAAVLTTEGPRGDGLLALTAAAARLSLRATVATAPIVWWCFESVPVAGLAANVLLVPIGSLVLLPLAAVHASVALTTPFAAPLTGALFENASAGFVGAAELFAALPIGRELPPPTIAQGIAATIVALAVLFVASRRVRIAALVAGMAVILALELVVRHDEQPVGELRATFLDVGQGDAALVDLPDGRLLAVDAGGGPGQPGERAIAPLLRARRRDRLDVLVLTHPHPDHYGGMSALLAAVEIREIWDSGQASVEDPDGEVARLLAETRRRGVRVREPPDLCRAPRRFGRATVEVVWPCPRFDSGYDPNDNSIVLRVSLGRRSFLLTGDAERHTEEVLLGARSGSLAADVLKVGHHGSRTSSTAAFLAEVRPRLAIVSAGVANRFGHPHPEVVDRLRAASGRVLTTAEHGGVVVTTDGQSLHARAWDGTALDAR